MNFIAGYLIIITKDEEKSFWLLDALLAKMLPGILMDLHGVSAANAYGNVSTLPLSLSCKYPIIGYRENDLHHEEGNSLLSLSNSA